MLLHFVNVQFCYEYLIEQIPVALLLYSHIPTALVALFFSGYVFFKTKSLSGIMLFLTCLSFALWCFLDLASWFAFLGSANTMFMWSLLDMVGILMFFFAYYFLYSFIKEKDLPTWQKIFGLVLILPTTILTFLGLTLPVYDANSCAAIENELLTKIPYVVEAIVLLASLILTFVERMKSVDKKKKKEIFLVGSGVAIFLLFFFSATLLVNFLAESDASLYVYNFEIYGLFGMPVLLVYLGFLIVRYKAFDLRVFGAQALSVALVVLIGSQFAFVQSTVTIVLTAISLVLTGAITLVLGRSIKHEIALRVEKEKLAKGLEFANMRQLETMRFITHEVKGYLTDASAGFDAITSESFGPVAPDIKEMSQEALRRVQEGVSEVKNFLHVSDFKTGKVEYAKDTIGLKELLMKGIEDMKKRAGDKKLTLTLDVPEGDEFKVVGDADYVANHVLKNLIDNAIHYTPQGVVAVSLSRKDGKVLFSVKDSGVGLTDEDKKVLFTEGGRGKDSRLVNVHSTGFGLFIAKQIVIAHNGRVWAESEGRGKGSTFFVEFPGV